MLGPDYELVLSDGGKSSYCMEVRNCSEDDVCMASLLTHTHTHTHTCTYTRKHTHVHTHPCTHNVHTHTCTHTHTPIYRMHSIGTIYHIVSPKDQLVKRRYMVLGYDFQNSQLKCQSLYSKFHRRVSLVTSI